MFIGQGHRLKFKITGGKQVHSNRLLGWPIVAEKQTWGEIYKKSSDKLRIKCDLGKS